MIAQNLKSFFLFEWSDTTIPYLGTELSPKMYLLYQANFPPMYKKLEADLKEAGRSINCLGWGG